MTENPDAGSWFKIEDEECYAVYADDKWLSAMLDRLARHRRDDPAHDRPFWLYVTLGHIAGIPETVATDTARAVMAVGKRAVQRVNGSELASRVPDFPASLADKLIVIALYPKS